MTGERTAIYVGSAFVAAVMVWVSIAFMRAEGMQDILDWKMGAVAVAMVTTSLIRRRLRKQRIDRAIRRSTDR